MSRKRKPLSLSLDQEAKKPKHQNNKVRRAGTVNRMVLKNFMCHSFLEVDLQSDNVYFVTGKNGSGKSALLTALIVGLGGKAMLTNRGNSLKNFIKVGKQAADIEIQLCNIGPMAYKPRIYGDTITIIRHFTMASSSVKTKSSLGEIISTQVREIQNIVANLNIQVDNPVCLLTQDTSRNFLSSNDPKNKFSLFMRATRLEMLEQEFKKTASNNADCIKLLAEKKKNYACLLNEMRQLRGKIKGHRSIVTLREQKITLQIEMVWAEVRDVENEMNEEQLTLDTRNSELKQFEASRSSKDQDTQIYENNITELTGQYNQVKNDLQQQKELEQNVQQELEQLQDVKKQKTREKQNVVIEIEAKQKDVETLQNQIANAAENMSKMEQQKQKRMKDLEEIQKKLGGFDQQLETTRNELFHIKQNLARSQEDENTVGAELKAIDHKIASERNSLEALQKESGNTLLLYGRSMPRVLELIHQNKRRFKQVPKGPLGAHIKLRDKKWALAAEGYIGAGILCAFAVDNQHDSKVLQEIFAKAMGREERKPTIITSKFFYQKHNVRQNLVQAPSDCVSLYDTLVIDDPVVANCVVDQRSVESILLIPSNARAMELMSNQNKVPANCHQGLTLNGDQYYPDPNYKTYASNYRRARFLQVDTEERTQLIEETINNLVNKRQVVQNQLQALQQEMHAQRITQSELEEKIRKVNLLKNKIRSQYEELSNQLEPEAHDITNLENVLEEIQQIITSKTAQGEKIAEELKEIQRKINETKETLATLKSRTASLIERTYSLQTEIENNRSQINKMKTDKEYDSRRLEEYQRKANNARATFVLKQTEVNNKKKQATKLGPRPENLRSVQDIYNDTQEVTRAIARIESESDDIEQVSTKYQELVGKHNLVEAMMQNLNNNLETLAVALKQRRKHYKLTENYFVTYMKHSFKKTLEFRQFKGTIDIDMQKKSLDLVVMPQQGSQGQATTSNLSGGERSFSTVAFLYSLWQCMDFPFYFLDEFDVYMDKLNRTKVIDILLHHARTKPELQFVFLTPQDVSFVTQNAALLRLDDPERNKA